MQITTTYLKLNYLYRSRRSRAGHRTMSQRNMSTGGTWAQGSHRSGSIPSLSSRVAASTDKALAVKPGQPALPPCQKGNRADGQPIYAEDLHHGPHHSVKICWNMAACMSHCMPRMQVYRCNTILLWDEREIAITTFVHLATAYLHMHASH